MTNLVFRKIPWEFDASVPFMWQPANLNFGLFCNAFTLITVPFERYIVNAVRKAQDKLHFKADQWISVRDHSWGQRPGVGNPIPVTGPRELVHERECRSLVGTN